MLADVEEVGAQGTSKVLRGGHAVGEKTKAIPYFA